MSGLLCKDLTTNPYRKIVAGWLYQPLNGYFEANMRNFLKKWFFVLGLALVLGLFCIVWGCFTQGKERAVVSWNLNPTAERIFNVLSLEQSMRSSDIEEVKRAARILVDLDPSENTFLDAAGELMFRGDKAASLEIAEKGRRVHPDSKKITLLYAEALMQTGRTEEGIVLLASYAMENPYETHIIIRLAELFIKLKQYSKANQILNYAPSDAKPTELDPSFLSYPDTPLRQTPYYLYIKAKILIGLNKTRDAEALLRSAVDKDPEFAEAWAELAFIYEKSKRPAEALEIYNHLLDMDRSNPAIWLRVVYAELQLGHVENAYAAADLGPPTASFLMQAGQLFTNYKEWTLAERIYLKAAAQPGVDDEVFLYLFLVACDGLRDIDRAIKYLDMITPKSPMYERAALYKIQTFTENRRFEEALQASDDSIRNFPAQKTFWQSKASLYHIQGRYADAEKVLDEALEHFPDDPELMFAKGALFDQINRKADAMRVMEAIVQKYPDDSAALNYIGYSLADSGVELDRARELIIRALEGDPENAHIIDSLAWVQYRMGRFHEAYENILKAVGFNPVEVEIWEHYGDIASAVNKPLEAAAAYTKALELEPENSEEIKQKLENVRD